MSDERGDHDGEEVPLGGGNISQPVKVGSTVRRIAGPWTPSVHSLLEFLHEQGFDAAPKPLGIDDQGREVLSFVVGEGGTYPMPAPVWSDAMLVDSARLMRRLHDLTRDFPGAAGPWRERAADPWPVEVICHSDWGPYNAVFRSGQLVAMIDWDFAGPGSRMWDLAWMAHSWVPLARPAPFMGPAPADPADQARRLRILCEAYGVEDRAAFLEVLWSRLAATPEWIEAQARQGEAAFQAMDADHYRRVLEYMNSIRDDIERALSA